jgi:predicted aspartyl protease
MKIVARKLVSRVKLQGRRFTVFFEDALIDSGAAFTVVPPETVLGIHN